MRSSVFRGHAGIGSLILAIVALNSAPRASAEVSGQQVFQQHCAVCHQLTANSSGTGPGLFDIFGRKAASRNFNYSEALKGAGKGGLVWDEASLRKWVTRPAELVPNNTMGFVGLQYPEDADALVRFLKNGGTD